MLIVEFEDDWAALYGDDGMKLIEGHTSDVRLRALKLAGVARRSATPDEEKTCIAYGRAAAEAHSDAR